MWVCKECGSDQVQELVPEWFNVNDGTLEGGAEAGRIDTYCEGCGENGIELVEVEDQA